MGDDLPFDPCECIFSPQAAMRRLISLLRNSQSFCTDEQCFGNPPGPGNNDDSGMTMMYMAIAWVIAALVLYLIRPQSLRGGGDEKPAPDRNDNNDSNRQPPPIM